MSFCAIRLENIHVMHNAGLSEINAALLKNTAALLKINAAVF